MSPLFRKSSSIEARLKKLRKELSSVKGDLRVASRDATGGSIQRSIRRSADSHEASPPSAPVPDSPRAQRRSGAAGGRSTSRPPANVPPLQAVPGGREPKTSRHRPEHDDRLADYLSTSFGPTRPLRHQRRIQRNKAIVLAVLAFLALFWFLYRQFFL